MLESSDPGASNDGSNVEIRHFGADDIAACEVSGGPEAANQIDIQIAGLMQFSQKYGYRAEYSSYDIKVPVHTCF